MPGPEIVIMGRLPQTPRARAVLQYSIEEANIMKDDYVNPAHILLGLLRENEGIANQVLANFGLTLDSVRDAIVKEKK